MYEAVIVSWREKRIWDLVRPTTLIKRGVAGDEIITYGGPYQGIQTINAKDFESYIRVMPHSEYPSASSCICMANTQFMIKWLNEKYGINDIEFSVYNDIDFSAKFIAESSIIEPGVTPKEDIFLTFSSLHEFNDVCGKSRLWGGMHFDASINGAYQLCDGIGLDAYEFMENLLNGNDHVFVDEEIPPFEDEYKLELKLIKSKDSDLDSDSSSGEREEIIGVEDESKELIVFKIMSSELYIFGAFVLGFYALSMVFVVVVMIKCKCGKNGSGFVPVPKYEDAKQ